LDKYEVLSKKIAARYPLRVFMRHAPETAEEHIKECLEVAETTADADYYCRCQCAGPRSERTWEPEEAGVTLRHR